MAQHGRSKLFQVLLSISLVGYLYILLYLTVFQRLQRGSVTGLFLESYQLNSSYYYIYSVNLIPFKTISRYLLNPPTTHISLTNLAGNILAFLPLGFLVPALIPRMAGYLKILGLSFIISAFIEIIQLLFRVGSADIDDVLLNTIGGMLGYLLFCLMISGLKKWTYIKSSSKEDA